MKGAIALISILIITAASLIIVLSVNLLSLIGLKTAFLRVQGEKSFYFSDGCIEEALVRLKRDPNYTGGSLTSENKICNVVVTSNLDLRTIHSIAAFEDKIRRIEMVVKIIPNGLKMISWREY